MKLPRHVKTGSLDLVESRIAKTRPGRCWVKYSSSLAAILSEPDQHFVVIQPA